MFTFGTGADYLAWCSVSRKWRDILSNPSFHFFLTLSPEYSDLWKHAVKKLWGMSQLGRLDTAPVLLKYFESFSKRGLTKALRVYQPTENVGYRFWKREYQIIVDALRFFPIPLCNLVAIDSQMFLIFLLCL